jgi:hypothetical protein
LSIGAKFVLDYLASDMTETEILAVSGSNLGRSGPAWPSRRNVSAGSPLFLREAETGYTISTKDGDCRQRSFLLGPPPKVFGLGWKTAQQSK